MKDLESLTVISVEYYCKVNPAWLTWKVIKCNQLHNFNKIIEKLHYLLSRVTCNL